MPNIEYLDNIRLIDSDEWGTPPELFKKLDDEFHFTLDVCAKNAEIAKCHRFFTPEQNGLTQDWSNETCWMNPPYSKTALWMKKATEEIEKGALIVALTNAKTEVKWFHEYAYKHEIRFIKGRLKFVNFNNIQYKTPNATAPFGSMITIFRKK